MPLEVLTVFMLYWVTTIIFLAYIIKINSDLNKKLNEKGE